MRVMVVCGAFFKGAKELDVCLGGLDANRNVTLFLLADQSPADKIPAKWCRQLKAPYKVFRTQPYTNKGLPWSVAWRMRDVESFDIGQPDLVVAFRGPATKTGERYAYVLEMARARGVAVREFVSGKWHGIKLKEIQ
jgi:hypothetical protein